MGKTVEIDRFGVTFIVTPRRAKAAVFEHALTLCLRAMAGHRRSAERLAADLASPA